MTAACEKCHRPLHNPQSIERGFGPVCYGTTPAEQTRRDPADESDFDYSFDLKASPTVLVITDLDKGGRSVTNNMENVLRLIADIEGLDIKTIAQTPIVYRDSEGNYDGVSMGESGAATIRPLVKGKRITNEQEAIQAARKETDK